MAPGNSRREVILQDNSVTVGGISGRQQRSGEGHNLLSRTPLSSFLA